jgi:hypothetical protein
MRAVTLGCFVVALLAGAPAGAEHEVYYRYVVLGFVTDAHGRPVSGRQVELIREKTGLSYHALSDAKGLFLIVARLGDESVGERLTLRAGKVVTRLTAMFDPKNHTDHRGALIDLEGDRFVERSTGFLTTLNNVLAP